MLVSHSSGVERPIISILDHHLSNMCCSNSSLNRKKQVHSLRSSSMHFQNISSSFHISFPGLPLIVTRKTKCRKVNYQSSFSLSVLANRYKHSSITSHLSMWQNVSSSLSSAGMYEASLTSLTSDTWLYVSSSSSGPRITNHKYTHIPHFTEILKAKSVEQWVHMSDPCAHLTQP
jgi:hypothetical protein